MEAVEHTMLLIKETEVDNTGDLFSSQLEDLKQESNCINCDKKIFNKHLVRKHTSGETFSFTKLIGHHNSCDFCEQTIIRKETLKAHEATVHNKSKYKNNLL